MSNGNGEIIIYLSVNNGSDKENTCFVVYKILFPEECIFLILLWIIKKNVRLRLLPGLPGRRCFFMENKERDPKREHQDKVRCANYLLQMFEKYGAEVMEENKEADKE